MPTRAPASANAVAIARPIPELAPVTTVRRPASASPACAGELRRLVLGAAGERVPGGGGVGEHRVDRRLGRVRAGNRQLDLLVVVVVDLLVVGRVPVDEHADDDAQVVDLVLRDDT